MVASSRSPTSFSCSMAAGRIRLAWPHWPTAAAASPLMAVAAGAYFPFGWCARMESALTDARPQKPLASMVRPSRSSFRASSAYLFAL